MFIQLQEVSFVPTIVNVPQYLLDDPVYGGGAALMYESADDSSEPLPTLGGAVRVRHIGCHPIRQLHAR